MEKMIESARNFCPCEGKTNTSARDIEVKEK